MYKVNPKTDGSGIITCIPQTGICPMKCPDCFFQSGRSYLEPLEENLPNIPPKELAEKYIVRFNDGNDSNVNRGLVEDTAKNFPNYFFNTSIPKNLETFSGPVVFTCNPADKTDLKPYLLDPIPKNLMFARVRTNMWNIEEVVKPAIEYYTSNKFPVVLTFMAYYNEKFPEEYKSAYEWRKRTLNSYWAITRKAFLDTMEMFSENPLVHPCGNEGLSSSCKTCGNCIREYYAAKFRMAL